MGNVIATSIGSTISKDMTHQEQKNERVDLPKNLVSTYHTGKSDPFERDPGAGKLDDERVEQAEEQEALQRESIHLSSSARLDDSTTSPIIHTGIPGKWREVHMVSMIRPDRAHT